MTQKEVSVWQRFLNGFKPIGFGLLLAALSFCPVGAYGQHCLSEASYLRLRVLLQSSLDLSDQQIAQLLISNQTWQNSQEIINSSSATIKSLSGSILNLQNLLQQSEQTAEKLSKSLTDQNNTMYWIAGGCVASGIIIGILIRGAL